MIKIELSIKKGKTKKHKIKFQDSYLMLPSSLDTLSKDFECEFKKGVFPYEFVSESKINYIGPTPDLKFYNNNVDVELYNSIFKMNWNLREETLNYLGKDLISLLEILEKFQSHLFIDHNLEMTEGLTISTLAKNKFFKYYLKNSKIPLINNNNLFNFIYSGYYGGITEVYKPFGENLTYLDVNSLYPFAAKNPMPGTECF